MNERSHIHKKADSSASNPSRRTFEYNTSGNINLFEGKGNCGTLAREFVRIGQQILNQPNNIKTMFELTSRLLYRGGGEIIGSSRRGNTDHGQHWIFIAHGWVIYKNNVIDVLFNRRGQTWIVGQERQDRFHFENEIYVRVPPEESTPDHRYSQIIETGDSSGNNRKSKQGIFDNLKAKGKEKAKSFKDKLFH